MILTPALGRLRQAEFKAGLLYRGSSKTTRAWNCTSSKKKKVMEETGEIVSSSSMLCFCTGLEFSSWKNYSPKGSDTLFWHTLVHMLSLSFSHCLTHTHTNTHRRAHIVLSDGEYELHF